MVLAFIGGIVLAALTLKEEFSKKPYDLFGINTSEEKTKQGFRAGYLEVHVVMN